MSGKLARIQALLEQRKAVDAFVILGQQGTREIVSSVGRRATFSAPIIDAAVQQQLHEIDVELARYGVEP